MTKLQLIREKCIEANPEIVELKFGCEVTIGTKQIFFVVGIMPSGAPVTVKKEGAYDSTKQGVNVEKINGKIKIIGRPLRLADVLLIMEHTTVRDDGAFFTNNERHPIHWNLKETFENQSEELYDFIYKILKEK